MSTILFFRAVHSNQLKCTGLKELSLSLNKQSNQNLYYLLCSFTKHVDRPQVCLRSSIQAEGNSEREEQSEFVTQPQFKQTKKLKNLLLYEACGQASGLSATGSSTQGKHSSEGRGQSQFVVRALATVHCSTKWRGARAQLRSPCLFFWLLSCERLSAPRCILKFFV